MNRRELVRLAGATGLGGAFLSARAAANGSDRIEIRKEESAPDPARLDAALRAELPSEIIEFVQDIDLDEAGAHRVDTFLDDAQVLRSYKVPTNYGPISIAYTESGLQQATLDLDRAAVRNERRFARNLGWPDGTDAGLVARDSTFAFVRGVTGDERRRLLDLIDRSDRPRTVTAKRGLDRGPGEYVVTYADETHYVHHNLRKVTRVERDDEVGTAGHGPGCQPTGEHCAIDLIGALPHCGLTAFCCSVGGPLACIVCLLDLCAPNLALVAVSGNCAWVARNCL